MRVAPELAAITNLVNKNIPRHARGVIDPTEMLSSGTANCFGRLALIGAALLENDAFESKVSFLISHTHALPFSKDRHWFGHAALAIDTPEFVLVDAKAQAFHRDLLLATSWASGHTAENVVVDFDKVPKPIDELVNWEELRGLEELTGPSHVHMVHHQFSVHSYEEGLAYYQDKHPFYSDHPRMEIGDYAEGYRGFTDSEFDSTQGISVIGVNLTKKTTLMSSF